MLLSNPGVTCERLWGENLTEWKLPARGEKLTLVLAVGSNAAPTQLACKFKHHGVVIPVLRCVLPDFDVVYAPAITSYGSCPGEASHDPASMHDPASVRGFCTNNNNNDENNSAFQLMMS